MLKNGVEMAGFIWEEANRTGPQESAVEEKPNSLRQRWFRSSLSEALVVAGPVHGGTQPWHPGQTWGLPWSGSEQVDEKRQPTCKIFKFGNGNSSFPLKKKSWPNRKPILNITFAKAAAGPYGRGPLHDEQKKGGGMLARANTPSWGESSCTSCLSDGSVHASGTRTAQISSLNLRGEPCRPGHHRDLGFSGGLLWPSQQGKDSTT